MVHKSPTLILNLDFVTIVSDASNSPSSVCNLCTSHHGEGLQVLHYEEHQKYEPHYDYFVDDFNTKNEGQRMATMLMYLADVEEGGETVFPAANMNFSFVPWYNELSACGKKGLSIKPRMGDALLFWSMRPDATLDPSNLHGGCPVIRGNKWSSTRPTVDNKPPSKGKNRTGIIVGVIVGLGLLSILAGVGIFIIRKRRNPYTDDDELFSMKIKPFTFTYSELKSATQDFNLSNKLGEGGFEPVYKVQTQMVQFSLKCSQVVDLLIRKLSSGSYHFTRLRGNFRSTGRSVGVEAQLTHLFSITQIIDTKLHQHLDKLGGGDYLCAIRIVLLHVIDDSSDSDENCRVTTEGTLTRRFWRVNKVVVKVTSSSDSDSVSDSGEKRRSKSDKKSRPSNQCGSKEVRNKHDEQRTGGKKRYDSDATEP
ncbi:unnamed protein product [Brassica rapa subsp. trilocularis]